MIARLRALWRALVAVRCIRCGRPAGADASVVGDDWTGFTVCRECERKR